MLNFVLFTSIALVSSVAFAGLRICEDDLSRAKMLSGKFAELLADPGGFYVRGETYILKHPLHAPAHEEPFFLSAPDSAKLLTVFDGEGRFLRDGQPQVGLFSFVLTDDRRLYVFRPGPRIEFTAESCYHTFPVCAAPLAAAGEMLFDRDGRLVAVDPITGHYRIDFDLSLFQIRVELNARGVPLERVQFLDTPFTEEMVLHHSVGR